MTAIPSATSERSQQGEWTASRAMLFIAGGSAVLWTAIVYGLMRLL